MGVMQVFPEKSQQVDVVAPFRRFPDSVPVTDGDTDGRPIVCDIAGGTGENRTSAVCPALSSVSALFSESSRWIRSKGVTSGSCLP